jgi:putative SOS response-associated peptidase YedK
MCGRVVVYVDIGGRFVTIYEAFKHIRLEDVAGLHVAATPRYNLGPAEWSKTSGEPIAALPIVALDASGNYGLKSAYWQFIPPYINAFDDAKANTKYSMYNIRLEEIAPTYRKAWSQRRALAVVDGVIEWCGEKGKRRAHVLRRRDGAPLALAAAWQRWRGSNSKGDGAATEQRVDGSATDAIRREGLLTASVAVGGADAWWGKYSAGGGGSDKRKQRMPRILLPDIAAKFLDPDLTEPEHVRALLDASPFPSEELLEAVEIDAKKVNNPYYDAADCVEPLSAA